jgi:cell shape-determining protein MreD
MPAEYLLLPANRAFIALSILVALVLDIMPWGRSWCSGISTSRA